MDRARWVQTSQEMGVPAFPVSSQGNIMRVNYIISVLCIIIT